MIRLARDLPLFTFVIAAGASILVLVLSVVSSLELLGLTRPP